MMEWEGTDGGVMPWEMARWTSKVAKNMSSEIKNWINTPGPPLPHLNNLGRVPWLPMS